MSVPASVDQARQTRDDVTTLLRDWRNGNQSALNRLTPLIYEDLIRLARARLKGERREFTLDPTALVHECYLRLATPHSPDLRDGLGRAREEHNGIEALTQEAEKFLCRAESQLGARINFFHPAFEPAQLRFCFWCESNYESSAHNGPECED